MSMCPRQSTMAKPFTIVVIILLAAIAVSNCQKNSKSTAVASTGNNDVLTNILSSIVDNAFLNNLLSTLANGPVGVILKPIGYFLLIITTPLRYVSAFLEGIGDGIDSLLSGIGGLVDFVLTTVSGVLEVIFRHIEDAAGQSRRRRAATNSMIENGTGSSMGVTPGQSDPLDGSAWTWIKNKLLPLLDGYVIKLMKNDQLPTEMTSFLGTIHTLYTAIHMLGII